MRPKARHFGLGCVGLILLFILALALGVPLAWDLLFGAAYCLDGYGCPWQ